jgi:hypothetical protein
MKFKLLFIIGTLAGFQSFADVDCAKARETEKKYLAYDYRNPAQRKEAIAGYLKVIAPFFVDFEKSNAKSPTRAAQFACLVGLSMAASPYEQAGGGGGSDELNAMMQKDAALQKAYAEERASFPQDLASTAIPPAQIDCRRQLVDAMNGVAEKTEKIKTEYQGQRTVPDEVVTSAMSAFPGYESCIGMKETKAEKKNALNTPKQPCDSKPLHAAGGLGTNSNFFASLVSALGISSKSTSK